MEPRQFDDISRALASGSSRRGVLKGMLGGLIAGVLGRSQALAQDDCPGGKVDICHRTNSKKNPYNYISICSDSLADHLAHGDTYCEGNLAPDGECGCYCPVDEIVCEVGTLNPDTCECEAGPDPECAGAVCGDFATCNDTEGCVCFTTSEGGGFCAVGVSCSLLTGCPNGQSDCGEDELCLVDTCCVDPVCKPLSYGCAEAANARFAPTVGDGPTTAHP